MKVSVPEFSDFTDDILRSYFRDADGSLALVACGGTRAGAISNAQKLADATGRTVYAFPSATVFSRLQGGMSNMKVTAFGAWWFPKLMKFTPSVRL
jgi:hypothetical protein